MNIKERKRAIAAKHVNLDQIYYDLEDKLRDKAYFACTKLLLDTAEREYKLNGKLVTQEEFFKDLNATDKYYFKDGLYMSKCLDTYKQRYRYTLIPQEAINQYAETLDEDSQFILSHISPKKIFVQPTWYGYTDMPDKEWHQDDRWED